MATILIMLMVMLMVTAMVMVMVMVLVMAATFMAIAPAEFGSGPCPANSREYHSRRNGQVEDVDFK